MGYLKNKAQEDAEDREARWRTAAEINDHRCTTCGEIPDYNDRETYFETGLCGIHAYRSLKDD